MNAQMTSPCRPICRYAALVTVLLLLPAIALAQAPPGAPDAVTLTRDDGTVTADWPAVSGATHYHVTYSTDGGDSWHAPVDDHRNVTTNRLTFSADNAKTYVVGVRAGNGDAWSGWVNSDPAGPFVPPTVTAARNDGDGSATVSWTPYGGGDFAYYRVIVCDDTQYDGASCDGTVFKSDPVYDANDTGPLAVTGLDAGTGYGVILQVWRSGATLKLHATLPALATLPLPTPAAPSGLSATAGGDDSVTLTWDDPADSSITGYEYQVNHNDTATGNLSGWGAWQGIAGSGAATTTHTITGLTGGREYRFRLRALNADIVSKAAPTAYPWYVTALQGAPTAPTGITVDVDLNVMTVGWNAVAGADGYDVRTKMDDTEWTVVAADVAATTVDVTILQIPDHTGVRARAGDAVSAWTDVSRLPPPDIFDPPSGGAGAQSQGGQVQNTLPKPTGVRVDRWNGGERATHFSKDYLTIRWDIVPGATGYRIACDWSGGERYGYNNWRKCGKDGSAWKVHGPLAFSNGAVVRYLDGPKDGSDTGNWLEMTYAGGSDYAVIVQAVKDGVPGAWSDPVDVYAAYPISWGPKVGNYEGLDVASRTASGFTLGWVHPYRGAGYVAECVEVVNGKPLDNWTKCSEDTNVFSGKQVDGEAVTPAQAHLYGDTASDRIVTVSITLLATGTFQQSFDPWKSYDVRVSTRNPSGQSNPDYPPLSIWEPYYKLAASNVTSSGATLSVTNYAQGWWYERTSPSGDSTCHSVAASPYTASLSSLTPGTSYTYEVYDQSGCNAVDLKDSVTFTTPKPAASEVTATTATLSLPNWSAAWWYKGNQSGASCTSVAAGTTTVNLGSLTAGTPYIYTAYSKDGCSSTDTIGTAAFTTSPLAKGRDAGKDFDTLNAAGNTSPWGLWSDGATMWVADYAGGKLYAYKMSDDSRDATKDFSTLVAAGNANPAGIWANDATLWVADDIDKKLYAYNRSDMSRDAAKDFDTLDAAGNDNPAGIWSDGVTMWVADSTDDKLYAYQMSDRSRDTAKDFNTLNAAGNTNPAGIWSDGATLWVADWSDDKLYAYQMSDRSRDAGKDFDTLSAASNNNPYGIWSDGATLWVADYTDAKLYAYQMPPRLGVSSVADTTATLTLANRTGDWYYQANSGPDSTCQGPVSGASEALSGLTAGASYVYTAYSQSDCNSANEIDAVTFSAARLTAGSLATTTATLTLTGHTGNWWVKQTLPAGGTCTAGEADFSHALSGLNSVTAYDYAAYRDSTCTTLIATATFTTHGLAAGSFSLTGATLTLTGHTGDWYYQADTGPDSTCKGPVSGTSKALSGLTGGTKYTYTAYSNSGCTTPIDTVPFATHGLRAVTLTPTGATLWLTGHTGDWWLKQTSPSAGTCTAGEADRSHALTGLTTGTSYTYTAYSNSTCATVIDTATFTPGYTAGERYAGKDFDTLAAAGNHGARGLWSDGTTLWVSDRDDKKIYAYKRSDTSRDSAKDFNTLDAAGNQNPAGIWSDGTTMWVADRDDAKLYAYKMSDKSRDAGKDFNTLAAAGNNDPYGLWSDGTTMYVVDYVDAKIYAYKMSDRSRDAGKDFNTLDAAGNGGPLGLWSDGVTLWVGDWDDDKLYAYRMNDRSRDAGKDFDILHAAGNYYGTGIWSDGVTLWGADIVRAKLYAYQMPAWLTASGVAASTATLTLANHTGNWWLKQTAPTEGTCTAGETDFSHALTTLTAGVTYTWTAYSKSGCASADALAAASFTTALSVSSLGNARNSSTAVGRLSAVTRKAAAQFTTGGNAGGYVLSAVTIDIDGLYGNPGGLTVAIYSDSGNRPNASLVTLSGASPSYVGPFTYTCAGSCALAAGTKYHVLLEAPHATGTHNHYSWETSASANEVTQPSNNGWSIGESYEHSSGTWTDIVPYHKFRVTAVPNPALSAVNRLTTTATLALAHHVGAWWYERTSPSGDDTCHRVADGTTTVSLATLTESTAYTYTAYSASGCNSADVITTATFSTLGPGDRQPTGPDFNTLSAAGNTDPVAVWSNGTTVWVTDWQDKKLYAYKTSDQSRDSAKDFNTLNAAGNTNPIGIWSDGTTMWVADLVDEKLYAYKMSDKSRDAAKDFDTLKAAGNADVRGIWSDGTTMWVADRIDDKLYAYKMSDTSRDTARDFKTLSAAGNGEPYGLWSDGTTMWVVDAADTKVYAYKTSDKARDATRDYDTLSAAGNSNPTGIWSDGTTTWIADRDDDKLYAYYARPPTKRLVASNLTDSGARLDITWHTAAWWYERTAPSGDTTCHSVIAGTTHVTLSGLDDGTSYTYKAYSASGCNSADELDTVSFTTPTAVLTATDVRATTATLAIANRVLGWYYKRIAPSGDTTCHTVVAGTPTASLASLTPGTTYTYTAYGKTGCASADALDTASFTAGVSVSSLGNARNSSTAVGRLSAVTRKAAAQFTTGGNAGGYVLSAVTIEIDLLYGNPGDLTVAIYSNGSNNRPNASLITLSGSNPTGAGPFTFTCAGSCALSAGTKYHVLLEAPDATGAHNHYSWETSASANEVTQPSTNGWSIGESYEHSSGAWSDITPYHKFRVTAVPNPSLTTPGLTMNSATLSLANYGDAWWYKRTSPSGDDTCHSIAAGTTSVALSTLTANTSYTYKAYSASGCKAADEITSVTFTTYAFTATSVTPSGATLTLTGYSGDWWYKRTAPSGDTTCHSVAEGTTTATLSLSAGTSYTYKAYGKTNCNNADEIAAVTFTTLVSFTASGVSASGATLTIAGVSGDWWYKRLAPSGDTTCHSVTGGGKTATLSSLTGGAAYLYKAYGKTGCASIDELRSVTFTTPMSISSLGNARNAEIAVGTYLWIAQKAASQFTTGSRPNGYELSDVTVRISLVSGSPGDLTVAIYSNNSSSNEPNASVLTLKGDRPTGGGEHTFTCTSDSCTLTADTEYHVLLEASDATGDSNYYAWENSTSGAAVKEPSDNGWSLGASHQHSFASWSDLTPYFKYRVRAVPKRALFATSVRWNSATLNLAPYTAAWWYKRTAPTGDDTCHDIAAGTTSDNLSLTSATTYTYKAYSKTGCNAADELHSVTFTTPLPPGLTAMRIKPTTADLVIANWSSPWYYKANKAPDNTCKGPVAAGTGTKNVTGLSASTAYVYTAYSDNGCATSLANTGTFTTRNPVHDTRLTAKEFDLPFVHGFPSNIWSNGTTLWSTQHASTQLYAYTLATRARDTSKEFTVHASNSSPQGIWSNGTTLWAAQNDSTQVYAYTLATEARDTVKEFTLNANNDDPRGIWSNGTTLWVADSDDRKLYAYTLATGARDTAKEFGLDAGNTSMADLWSDGTTMWVSDWQDGKLYAYTLAGGARDTDKEFDLHADNSSPEGIWSDGTTMWVANTGGGANKMYAYTAYGAPALTATSIAATSATLSLADYGGAWWYERTTPSGDSTCYGVANGTTTASLASLTAGTAYTYEAYSASGCNNADKLDTASFTTLASGMSGGSVGNTGVTLAWQAGAAGRGAAAVLPAPSSAGDADDPAPDPQDAAAYPDDFNTLAAAGNTSPDGIWSDGATLWVVDAEDRMLYAYDLRSKARDPGRDVILSANTLPLGLASDGVTLWVSDYEDDELHAYDVATRSYARARNLLLHPANAAPSALWTDGATLWAANDTDGKLYAYTLASGARAGGRDVTLHPDNASAGGLWSDGVTLWVSDPDADKVYAYRLSDGRRAAAQDYALDGANREAYGLWSDGTTLWVVDDGADRVFAYEAR